MNKHFRTLLAFSAIGVTSAALPAFGSDLESVRVTVPFAFTAGTKSLPAGEYTIIEDDAHVLLLRGTAGSAFVFAIPGAETDSDKTSLSFGRTEKGYFLKAVKPSGRPSSVLPAVPVTER